MADGKRYWADVDVKITVSFEDDGESDLRDQAIEAVWEHDFSPFDSEASIVGDVRETESPAQSK